jgi:hypothetical protein
MSRPIFNFFLGDLNLGNNSIAFSKSKAQNIIVIGMAYISLVG